MTQVEKLQVGDYVNAASPVFALVAVHDFWIDANFKEVQLAKMREGQTATVKIDTYGDRTFKAHVVSLSPGTGAQFSVLPAQNATGNWVKVVQRLAVRLEIEDADARSPAVRRPQRHGEGRYAGSGRRATRERRLCASPSSTSSRIAD